MPRFLTTIFLAAALAGAGPAGPVLADEHGAHAGHDGEADHSAETGHDDDHHDADEHHDDEHHGDDEDADHLSEGLGLRILHGWTRATDSRDAFVFAEIENVGEEEIALLGAETGIARGASLVGLTVRDGRLTFQPLPGVPIPPGREMLLAPDGLAIRLEGLEAPLSQGTSFPLHLHFSEGALEVEISVEAPDAASHSHAGHAH